MAECIWLDRLRQNMGHFLSSLASICITAHRSSCQNTCSECRSLRSGGTKDRFVGNVRNDLTPEIALCTAAHRDIALHRLAQCFFHAQRAQMLFERYPLQNGPVKMSQLMETAPANDNAAGKRIPV